ncbi:MAG TPA: D-alanyl-D-alanine carboxypeptidase, partial [Kofleriaceae bacterium]|nr:D-alanyl-D-alanine carboxypeptidase [Kofleriaceae bacterium]
MRASAWSRAVVVGAVLCCFTTSGRSQEADEPDPAAATEDGGEPAEPPAPSIAGDAAALSRRIDQALARATDLGSARVGILAVDLATGETLHERDADGRYNIASNAKTLTTAAALRLLGPGFKFRTVLYAQPIVRGEIAGNLYVRGGGDPTLGRYDLVRLADELRALGVERIRGNIVIDES